MLLSHLLLDVVTPFTIRITSHLHISGKLQSVLVTIIIIIIIITLLYKTLYFFNKSQFNKLIMAYIFHAVPISFNSLFFFFGILFKLQLWESAIVWHDTDINNDSCNSLDRIAYI